MAYSPFAVAALPDKPIEEMYSHADLIFVGKLLRIENEESPARVAVLRNLLTIKGEALDEVTLCSDDHQERLGVRVIGEDSQVYFFRKKNSCHVGAFGYKSIIYIKKGTNCIFAQFAYYGKEYIDKLEPLETFVSKLTGGKSISFPESLKGNTCGE